MNIRFDTVVTTAAWLSSMLRVAQFVLFSDSPAWRGATIAVLTALLLYAAARI